MEEWYQQQDYFCETRLNKIQAWMDVEFIGYGVQFYNINNLSPDPEAA